MIVNDRPCKVFIDGDTNAGAKWVPWAKRQIESQQRISGACWSKVFYPASDTEVVIDAIPARYLVRIKTGATVWLDSGLVDPVNYTLTPGKIYTGSSLDANVQWGKMDSRTLDPKPAHGPVVDGQDAGCMSYTPSVGEDLLEAEESLAAKKMIANACPPSHFPGKMRLFVQGLYGRKFTRGFAGTIRMPGLTSPGLSLQNQSGVGAGSLVLLNVNGNTTGLHTDSQYNYSVVDLSIMVGVGVRVTITPLKTTGAGKETLAYLRAHAGELSADEVKRRETAVLAYSWPDFEAQFSVLHTDIKPAAQSALAYGWAFNWSGNTAQIIVHGSYSLTDPVVVGTVQRAVANHYMMTFTRNPTAVVDPAASESSQEQSRWTIGGAAVFEGTHWLNNWLQDIIWVPDYISGGLFRKDFVVPFQAGYSSDVDIHCYYDSSDRLNLIHFTSTVNNSVITTTYDRDPAWPDPAYFGYTMGTQKSGTSTRSAASSTGEFRNNASGAQVARTSYYDSVSTFETFVDYSLGYNETDLYVPIPPVLAGIPGVVYGQVEARYAAGADNTYDYTDSANGVIALVFPWSDCQASYFVSSQANTTVGNVTKSRGDPAGTGSLPVMFRAYSDSDGPPHNYITGWIGDDQQRLMGGSGWASIVVEPVSISTNEKYFIFNAGDGTNVTLPVGTIPISLWQPAPLQTNTTQTLETVTSGNYADWLAFQDTKGNYPTTTWGKIFVGFA